MTMEKKSETVTFRTTTEIARALIGLASVADQTRSDYIHQLLADVVERKTADARLLIDALGIHKNEIHGEH
jgi:predicted transcriptional regulator